MRLAGRAPHPAHLERVFDNGNGRRSNLRRFLHKLGGETGFLHRVDDLLRHVRRIVRFHGHAPGDQVDLGLLHAGDRLHGLRHVRLAGRAPHPAHLK